MLCDLGLSRVHHTVSRSLTYARTTENYRYLAPELVHSLWSESNSDATTPIPLRPTEDSDLYAAGMTFFELGTQQRPLSHIRSPERAAEMAMIGERPRKPPSLGGVNREPGLTELWEWMECLWAHEPEERPLPYNLWAYLRGTHGREHNRARRGAFAA